jgi:hypothetical protein
VKNSAAIDAEREYQIMVDSGKLKVSDAETARAVGDHASLAKANHFVNNPPAHAQRMGLTRRIGSLEHEKGPSWITESGVDRNLGNSGATSRVANNRLKNVQDLDGSGDEVVVIVPNPPEVVVIVPTPPAKLVATSTPKSAAKSAPEPTYNAQTSRDKVERLQKRCKGNLNHATAFADLTADQQSKQMENMQASKFLSKSMREGTCNDVVDILHGGEEEWEVGQSQAMHQQIMKLRAYEK